MQNKMDKISPIKGRALQYIEYKSISKQDFCKHTGISYANMKGQSLFSEIGGSQLAEILSFYEDISPEWLLTGKGEMLKSSDSPIPQPQKSHNIEDNTLTSLLSEIKELRMENKELNKQIGRLEGTLEGKDEVINILKDELRLLKKDFPTPNVRAAKRAAI